MKHPIRAIVLALAVASVGVISTGHIAAASSVYDDFEAQCDDLGGEIATYQRNGTQYNLSGDGAAYVTDVFRNEVNFGNGTWLQVVSFTLDAEHRTDIAYVKFLKPFPQGQEENIETPGGFNPWTLIFVNSIPRPLLQASLCITNSPSNPPEEG